MENMNDVEVTTSVEQSETDVRPSKPRLRRCVIAIVLALGVIFVLQWRATEADHQMANFGSFIAGLLAMLFVTIQTHLAYSKRGYRYLVPSIAAVVLAVVFSVIRFDGFSGELMPQFAWRFETKRELPTVMSGEPTASPADDSADHRASTPSSGFLGNNRTGIVSDRDFAIPESVADVTTLWDQRIGEGWSSFAVFGDRAVTLEQREKLECVTCYRLSDGELIWINDRETRHENALGGVGPRSTPTIDGGRVYTQGATGRVDCFDLLKGEKIWSVDLLDVAGWDQSASEAAITWGRAGSPLIVDGLCVVPFGGPDSMTKTGRSLIALDANDGSVRWTAGEDQISYGSPTIMTLAGTRQIVTVNESTVTGHVIGDGTPLWEFSWPGQSNGGANCASAVPAGKDKFVVGKGYGGGSALVEVTSGDEAYSASTVWSSSSILKTKFTHACVVDNVAYGISNGSLEAVDLDTQDVLWRQSRGQRLGQGQLLLVDDLLIGQSESGEVVFVDANPDEYVERLRLPAMETKTWNIPTIAGRHLLVRNDRQAIAFLLPAN